MKTKMKRPVLYYNDDRTPAKEISRQEALDHFRSAMSEGIYGSRESFTAVRSEYFLSVLGSSVFWKKTNAASLTFKDGKIYGQITPFRDRIIEIFNLNWISDNDWTLRLLAARKDLWKAVILGTVTNPEDLAKLVSKKYFKRAFSWKSLRKYFSAFESCSLWDLYYYTTNPDLALQAICDAPSYVWKSHFCDALAMAKYFNEKINPKWSLSRLTLEHQKQIEKKEQIRLETLSNIDIAPAFYRQGLSLILNEKDCYLEGCTMHHCVHSCYWRKVTAGNYLIARGTVEGVYIDLGIRLNGNSVLFDQVHGAYNSDVPREVETFCCRWIESYAEELCNIGKKIKGSLNEKSDEYIPW